MVSGETAPSPDKDSGSEPKNPPSAPDADPDLDEDVPPLTPPKIIMATTEVLLVEHIQKLGSEGVVKVRPGFGEKLSDSSKKALPLNLANKRRLDALKQSRAK